MGCMHLGLSGEMKPVTATGSIVTVLTLHLTCGIKTVLFSLVWYLCLPRGVPSEETGVIPLDAW